MKNKYIKLSIILIFSFIFILITSKQVLCNLKDSSESEKIIENKNSINHYKLSAFLALTVGAFGYGQVSQFDKYWGDRSEFNIMKWSQEYDDALMADKFGHLYFTYSLSQTYSNGLQLCGVDTCTSTWIGSIVGLSFQTYVEIQDGYSTGKPYLGFSRGDIMADISGASLPLLHYYFPQSQFIKFKASLEKSKNFEKNNYSSLSDDYESTFHWLVLDFDRVFPSKSKYIPDFIDFSIGHSVQDINRNGSGNHRIFLSLDWDISKFDTGIDVLDFIIHTINFYKLPAPAIQIYPNVVWYGLKL